MIELEKILRNVKYDDIEYPVDQWQPEDCGLDGFRINRFGDWFFQDSQIKRHSLVVLLSKLLRKEGKQYYVVSPVEKIRVDVDCYPFCILLAEQKHDSGEESWVLTLNTGATIILGPEHPLSLYHDEQFSVQLPKVKVRGDLFAAVNRNVYYQWVSAASQRGNNLIIKSCQCEFQLNADEI